MPICSTIYLPRSSHWLLLICPKAWFVQKVTWFSSLFSGSGKSYSMMGAQDNKGLIPRLCDNLFEQIAIRNSESINCAVEVSYMEIYNEKVRDLLDPNGSVRLQSYTHYGPLSWTYHSISLLRQILFLSVLLRDLSKNLPWIKCNLKMSLLEVASWLKKSRWEFMVSITIWKSLHYSIFVFFHPLGNVSFLGLLTRQAVFEPKHATLFLKQLAALNLAARVVSLMPDFGFWVFPQEAQLESQRAQHLGAVCGRPLHPRCLIVQGIPTPSRLHHGLPVVHSPLTLSYVDLGLNAVWYVCFAGHWEFNVRRKQVTNCCSHQHEQREQSIPCSLQHDSHTDIDRCPVWGQCHRHIAWSVT